MNPQIINTFSLGNIFLSQSLTEPLSISITLERLGLFYILLLSIQVTNLLQINLISWRMDLEGFLKPYTTELT